MRKWGIMRSGHSNVPRLTTGDLFAGAGGLSVGFHNAGFTPLFFNEIDDLAEVIDPETLEANRDVFNRWLKRGDGIAVYENKAMDSIHYGHRVFLSFGSEAAQIESAEAPEKMPDTGWFSTSWAYALVGTYRGDTL